MVEIDNQILSEDEAALYDRQIRLWGLDAQKRLRAAKTLVAGCCGLGAEVIKNLVLAGIKSLTILDHRAVTELDTYSNFLAPKSSIGKNIAESSLERSQTLNPMVQVSADTQNIEDLGEDYFTQFDVVCLCRCSKEQIIRINNICRKLKILFYAGDVYGMHGFSFADLMDHKFVEEVKENKTEVIDGQKHVTENTKMVQRIEKFAPFSASSDIDWTSKKYENRLRRTTPSLFIMQVVQEFEFLHKRRPDPSRRQEDELELLTIKNALFDKNGIPQEKLNKSFVDYLFGQVSPVCAILGGVLGQEIIKAVSQKDPPLNNFFFFSSEDCAGIVENLGY